MNLSVKITKATDGCLALKVVELPQLDINARNAGEIPLVVSEAAVKLTGRPERDFNIDVGC